MNVFVIRGFESMEDVQSCDDEIFFETILKSLEVKSQDITAEIEKFVWAELDSSDVIIKESLRLKEIWQRRNLSINPFEKNKEIYSASNRLHVEENKYIETLIKILGKGLMTNNFFKSRIE